MRETWVWSLGQEDLLKKEMAMEEPGRPQSMELQRGGHDWATSLSLFLLLSCFFFLPSLPPSLYLFLSHPYITTGKTIALTRWTFVGKVMSLLFNTLPNFVIALLPRSKRFLISWLQSSSAVIVESRKIKSVTVSIVSPSIWHEVMGLGAMILVFECWVLRQLFHSPLSPSWRGSLVSSLPALRVVSSAYLRLFIFLLAIWIPACASSSPAFCVMYSALS